MTTVSTVTVPCIGGPLTHYKAHEPLPTRIPCSDGRYVLAFDNENGYFYRFEPEGRRPVGARADD